METFAGRLPASGERSQNSRTVRENLRVLTDMAQSKVSADGRTGDGWTGGAGVETGGPAVRAQEEGRRGHAYVRPLIRSGAGG